MYVYVDWPLTLLWNSYVDAVCCMAYKYQYIVHVFFYISLIAYIPPHLRGGGGGGGGGGNFQDGHQDGYANSRGGGRGKFVELFC